MSEPSRNSQLAAAAAILLFDGRDPNKDFANILITLDHTIALILLATNGRNARKAVAMFNEGVVPHVEERIMMFAAKDKP